MPSQIRVPPKTHRDLRRISKATGVPVTKIVARAVDKLLLDQTHNTEGNRATDGHPSPAPRSES